MWRHVEAVYEASPHTGNTHQVLAYLAGRAHLKSHTCYPGNDRIAQDLRITKRTVIRALQTLEETGCILRITTGNGRGHASMWQLSEQYRPKGDTVTPFVEENSDMVSPITEKGDIDDTKGDIHAQKGDMVSIKGDMVSPQRIELNKNNKKEQRERDTHPRKAPKGSGSYETLWYEFTGTWLGAGVEEYLRERLGENPRWELVRTASARYRGRGYRANDVEGITDWYQNLLTDPGWEAPKRGRASPQKANGNGPKTFDQIRQDNNLKAIEEARAMMNRSNG